MDLLLECREAAIRGRAWRLALATALLAAVALALPSIAFGAGRVTVDGDGVLIYTGGSDANVLSVSFEGGNYVLTENGITSDSSCFNGPAANQVTCTANGGRPLIDAGAGSDTVTLESSVTSGAVLTGGPGDDALTGGPGPDTASYATSTAGVTVSLARTDAQDTGAGVDTLSNIENLDGSRLADVLSGSSGANAINGFAGDDQIDTADGLANDAINCGPGAADRFTVDAGDTVSACEDDGVPPDTAITSTPPDLSGSGTATFAFSSSDGSPTFECSIDGGATWEGCGSPKSYNLSAGTYTFSVRAIDAFGHADTSPATYQWTVDLGAPNINIDSAPSGTITTDSATFAFSSPDSDLKRFDCRIDGSDWVECTSPVTLSFLPNGPHTFSVRAVDKAGNVGALTLSFTVAVPRSGVLSRPANSLVLIAGNTVKVTKRGYAYIALNCSGTRDCAGRVLLDTSKKVRAGRRKRIVRLGRAKFQIKATRTRRVRIHIPRSKMRLLRKLRKVNTDIIVRDRDGAGRARVSSRTIVLKAPPRR